MFVKGSLEVTLPTIWRDEKQRREERRLEERKRKSQKKEATGARHVRKSRNTVFSNDLWVGRVEK